MGLQRKCFLGDISFSVDVNVYDVRTKEIVFSGSQMAAGRFLNVHQAYINVAVKRKSRVKKIYAIRLKHDK